MKNTREIEGYVPVFQKTSYSIASAGGNIISVIISMFISTYMTDSVGISAAAVGTMMFISRFLDLGTDFLVGSLVDKTRTKYGKARPWILASVPMVFLFLILFFSTPKSLSSTGKLIYCCIVYLLINAVSFTVFVIPHTALISRMTLNALERQKIASLAQIFNQGGAIAVVTLWVPLVAKVGYQWTACIFGAIAAVMISFAFFGTRETIDDTVDNTKEKIKKRFHLVKHFSI